MASNQDQRYDAAPPIPTYDEAVAGGSAWHHAADDPRDHATAAEAEGQSLLTSTGSARHAFESHAPTQSTPPRGRRPRGYRPPTVETDDESNLFSSDSDSDTDSDDEREAAQVRREMQELEIDDSDVHGRGARSSWGKRIALSLPQWRWKWRLRLPALRRPGRAAGGSAGGQSTEGPAGAGTGTGTGDATEAGAQEAEPAREPWMFQPPGLPKFGSAALLLLVARMMALLLVLAFLYLLFASDLFANMARRMGSRMFDTENVRMHVQASVDPRRIRDHLRHFTSYAHMAGTAGDYALMEDTEMLFRKYGLEGVTRDVYHVYLNYPKADGRAVELLGPDGKPTWSARLEEEQVGGISAGRQTFVFHGHSKSGDVKGPLIYANYGTKVDFQALKDRGVDTKGAIALVRYYGPQADVALKVKAAEEAGFAGCITYSDPADDGFVKGKTAPKGRFMPADGVQRESVSLRSWVVGDVLTPGWGSKANLPRMKVGQTKGLVNIPSLPLAWRDAQPLLQALKGSGQRVPDEWVGGVPDVAEWWTGNGSSPVVRLKNEQHEVERQPIWNVYGRITGIEQREKKVIIGNHRDSMAFGAADPHSGTAVMMEIIRILGDLVARGWQPSRTIEFASWDGHEYNLIGSTEYVEHNDEALREDAFAYINLDKVVTGGEFHAAGSPVFRKLLLKVLNRVADPHFNATLRDRWDRRNADIDGLGVDSDYVAFQNIAGTSSLDLRFDGDKYPSRSSHANFELMEKVIDPGFIYHTLMGQVVGLMVLELADRPILPFDMTAYGDSLSRWVDALESWAGKQGAPEPPLLLNNLKHAAMQVAQSIRQFRKFESTWEDSVIPANGFETAGMGRKRAAHNARMTRFESDLLDEEGIPGRTQFKHVVFGPQAWSRDPDAYFPAVRDAMLSRNWTLARLAADRAASVLQTAARNLVD